MKDKIMDMNLANSVKAISDQNSQKSKSHSQDREYNDKVAMAKRSIKECMEKLEDAERSLDEIHLNPNNHPIPSGSKGPSRIQHSWQRTDYNGFLFINIR